MISIGRSRQSFGWLANDADAWVWHGVNLDDTNKIVRVIKEYNKDNTWHPFGYANFVELLTRTRRPGCTTTSTYAADPKRSPTSGSSSVSRAFPTSRSI